eukprot:CAMPEP_0206290320 /NCGR_PEP_ID=MMETSP0106_2-20121207/2560_1 /ASSEMBLY_ACC=CAM_ASM_000206 /TAXON_ID=81532 /ORGANISM="Acanthoeca-like sp., Strain 10tr" /LENGTH=276 /DNA_ID=CAMNT_0053720879 /DNA_START=261 /DNA_END=1089 /DNA_ORIENTATION=+
MSADRDETIETLRRRLADESARVASLEATLTAYRDQGGQGMAEGGAAAAVSTVSAEDYKSDGYLHIPGALRDGYSMDGIPPRVPVYDEVTAGLDPENPRGLRFLQQLLLVDELWLKLAVHPKMVAVATALLGPDVNLHHAKASLKPPGHISQQSWHQDGYYLNEDPPDFLTILVYLDDTAPGAGATKIAVGSHHNGLIVPTPADDGRKADGSRPGGTIPGDFAERQGPVIEPAMAVGDAVVLSPFVVHSVGDNHSKTTKAALAFAYKAAGSVDREA